MSSISFLESFVWLKVPVMWATSKVNRHDPGGRIGSHWTGIEIGPHLLTLRFENKEKRRKVTKRGPNILWFLLSCFRRFRCLCSKLLPFRPFFFLIVLDDLGWSDVGFHGSQINTTNMDKLVSEGVILDKYYVQPICSPTRGALLTGMYPTHTVKKSLRNYAQHLYLHYFNWIGCLYSQWCHRSSLVMFSKVSIPPLNSFLWFTDNFFATSGINKWFILVSQDNLFKDESTRIRNWSPALPYGSPNLSDQ